jgi:hypothetical protein
VAVASTALLFAGGAVQLHHASDNRALYERQIALAAPSDPSSYDPSQEKQYERNIEATYPTWDKATNETAEGILALALGVVAGVTALTGGKREPRGVK